MNIQIGIGPDSWGVWELNQPNQVPWQRFLDEVVEAGYLWIEAGPYGYLPTDLHTLRRELDMRGLGLIATTVMNGHLEDESHWPRIENDVVRVGEMGAALGAKYLVLIDDAYIDLLSGNRVRSSTLDEDGWKRLIEVTNKIADIVQGRFGLTLTLHPNAETHVETEEHLERVLEETDPALVSLCLDTGHLAYTGGDPVRFMAKHHDRIPYLHLKNVDLDLLTLAKSERMPMVEATAAGVFCEPMDGMVDFEALVVVLRDVRYEGWVTVEQDMYQPPMDKPLPVAKRTRSFLREIGMG